ncbi:MAG TPA: pyridoxal phosphate-dependent aminotransferase, partial [Bacteroidia bacterium]|nr:pyridoxal phosphate-dependent aminotransferase [Bacteroidia bacterium]
NFPYKIIEYSHSAGIESYRKKLAEYYKKNQIELDYTQIMVTTGGSEAIEIAMMTCFNEGDEIIIPEPFYANYNGFGVAAGIVVKPVTSDIRTGFALPPISKFEEIITPKTKGIMICNPNNPTGYLYSKEEIEQLGALVKKHNLFLLVDEVYREFCYDGKEHFSVMRLKGVEENVIMLDSVSKRYSACGLRIGALITRNQEVLDTALKFAQARLSPPTIGQVASEAAVNVPKEYFDKVEAEYTNRRNTVVGLLNKIEGVFCPMPSGAFYCFASLPVDDADKFCQWLLEEFDYEKQTVMLAPASGFYSNSILGKQEVRIAYVLNEGDLKKAMVCLDKALQVYPGRVVKKEKTAKA